MIKVNYYNCARLLICVVALLLLNLAPAAPKTAQERLLHSPVSAHFTILGDTVAPLDLCTACAEPGDPEAVLPLTDTLATNTPKGLSPQDLQSAYQLPSMSAGYSSTVAIVDVGNAPTLERDLNTYSAQYGLPLCTHIRGCLQVVNQEGKPSPLPPTDHDWAVETSLDVQMVHAVCPHCRIVLVEADAAYLENLVQAEQTAASFHPDAISNSWGSAEPAPTTCPFGVPHASCMTMADAVNGIAPYFTFPGVAVTVSSGDDGYGVGMPADLAGVVAVGGTSLKRDNSARGWSETAWSGAGSGCSLYIPKPAWQNDRYCAQRTVSDVSWVADPQTGVAVFDSTPYWSHRHKQWRSGWIVVGGTSVGAPAIAAVYGLAHNAQDMANPGAFLYQHASDLWDVMGGSNGVPWHPVGALHRYYTDAGPGYDGPTGNGSPKGTSAF